MYPVPLVPQVYEEQVGKTVSNIMWQERKSMIAVCDEIGMANIKVTKVNKNEPEKLMKTKGADAQLYGATICARLGWQTNCFQVLSAHKNRSSAIQRCAFSNACGVCGCRSLFQLRTSRP